MKNTARVLIGGALVACGCGFFLYPNFREWNTQREVEQIIETCLPHKLSILNMLNERKWRMWGAAKNIRWLIWPHPQRVARLTAIRHALLIAATIQSRHDMRGERLIIRVSLLFGVGWVWIGIVFLEKVTLFVVIFSSYSFIGETMSTRSAHSYCRGHMAQAQIYRQSVTFFVC